MAVITYGNHLTAEQFNGLRQSVGWSAIEDTQARTGLAGTASMAVALDGDRPVGMARLISDGGYVAIISDVIVHPEYQRQGIGRALMERLLAPIRETLGPGQRVMVNLMSMEGKEPFYESLGFQARPTEEHGAGMVQWIRGPEPAQE